jgi:hypothetical protein
MIAKPFTPEKGVKPFVKLEPSPEEAGYLAQVSESRKGRG